MDDGQERDPEWGAEGVTCSLKIAAGKLSGKRILVGRLSGETVETAGTEGIILSGKRTEGHSFGDETSVCSSQSFKRAS